MKKSILVSPSQKKGHYFENHALKYLKKHGLKLIEQNYSCVFGEIDLILKDKDTLVFVEVRFRKNTRYGGALESVHYAKQKKIIKTAKLFLLERGLYEAVPCRFDVIGLTLIKTKEKYLWIKNAFQ